MQLAIDVNVNKSFFWKPVTLAGTPFTINRVVLLMMLCLRR